jgi:SAM-dependent methyltransferase
MPRPPVVHRLLSRLRVARVKPGSPWILPADPAARQEAVVWAHRILRGTEPASRADIARMAESVRDVAELRAHVTGVPEPNESGCGWALPATQEGRREAVRWAYRTLLLREPDSAAALDFLATRAADARDLRNRLLDSAEARAQPGMPVRFSMTGEEPPQSVQTRVTAGERERLFRRVQQAWRALGETKPHWSVVTAEEFTPARIEETLEHFYATGEQNVATLIRTLERNGVDPAALRTCLDFGCGVGRLSVALARRFARVVAVDVSPSHLAIAREAIAKRGVSNIELVLLETIDGVAALPRVDLVYSIIVLQHNPPPVMLALFEGLLARLNPGGVAVIQIPTYLPPGYRFDLAAYEATPGGDMEMHALPQAEAFRAVREAGVEVLEVLEDGWTGYGAGARSNTFVMRRPR